MPLALLDGESHTVHGVQGEDVPGLQGERRRSGAGLGRKGRRPAIRAAKEPRYATLFAPKCHPPEAQSGINAICTTAEETRLNITHAVSKKGSAACRKHLFNPCQWQFSIHTIYTKLSVGLNT
jgi:hypothetical protein